MTSPHITLLVFRIAWRYLRAPRREGFISVISWFSVIGIFLGVATLIIVMAVMNGFRHDLLNKIVGVNGHIMVRGNPYALPPDHPIEQMFKNSEHIVHTVPFVEGQAMLTAHNFSQGILLTGIKPQGILSLKEISIAPEDLQKFENNEGMLIGSKLARKLRIAKGQSVTLISSQTSSTAFGRIPRSKAYKVIGTFEVGMYQIDNSLALLPLDEAARFFKIPEHISGFRLILKDPESSNIVSQQLKENPSSQNLSISNWKQNNATLTAALEVERNVMFIILTLIILVAAFNIISGQIMLVRDKSRGIAILRTMGMPKASILAIFLIVGSSLGFVGTLLGSLGGVWFAHNLENLRNILQTSFNIRLFQEEIYFLTKLPSRPELFDVILVSSTAFLLVFLASLYPAWRAMKLQPVTVLRDHA